MIRGVSPSTQDKWLARKTSRAPVTLAPKVTPTPIIRRTEGFTPDLIRIIASGLHRRLKFANRAQILEHVMSKHNVSLDELRSEERVQRIAHARQEAFFLLRRDLNLSLNQIGRIFGGRDHSTILFGIKAHLRRKADGSPRKRRPAGLTYKTRRPLSTHCTKGHLLEGKNVRIDPQGYRRCRTCCKLFGRSYRAKQKEQLNRGLGM
jgi:hypothetical protein